MFFRHNKSRMLFLLPLLCALTPLTAWAGEGAAAPTVLGVRIEFILFGLTLLGVALFHHKTMQVALTGLAAITTYKLCCTGFHAGPGFAGLASHLGHEWVTLTNLLGLLLGFEILAHHFSASKIPAWLPKILPAGAPGAFVLLALVFILSSFLDNIAAAMIGGTIAATVFKGKIHTGYLAAIVAASNAGGSGSVVGDTTTTMMWIDGINPLNVLHAYIAAGTALVIFGIFAARQQHKFHPITHDGAIHVAIDHARVGIVATILACAIGTNVLINTRFSELADLFPWIGAAVWVGILVVAPVRRPHWGGMKDAFRGSVFLLALVTCASMMPVETLPKACWQTAFGLGVVSAVFDNIPLTKLALTQGGYDWGFLAYAVGFGGSMLWFGSSAGVAISNLFHQAKDTGAWLRGGWHVALAYAVGFLVLLHTLGWNPHAAHKATDSAPAIEAHR
jgi:Na+/H+ antiporter NhaD/arsenite permease-like protein